MKLYVSSATITTILLDSPQEAYWSYHFICSIPGGEEINWANHEDIKETRDGF